MMRRRVMALVLTLVVAGPPEALAICQFVCASSTSHSDTESHGHAGHASHQSAAPSLEAFIKDEAHPCREHDQLSTLTAPAPQRSITTAILTTVAVVLPALPVASLHVETAQASGSASVPLHAPLRI